MQGKRLDFRTSLDDESFGRAIAVAGLYELEQLITEIHENNPMLGTIEASGRMKAAKHESDENKEVTNEKNNNSLLSNYSLNLKFLVSEDLKRLHLENKDGQKISVYCSQKLISEKELDGSSLIHLPESPSMLVLFSIKMTGFYAFRLGKGGKVCFRKAIFLGRFF